MTDPSIARQTLFDVLRRSAARHPGKPALKQHDISLDYRDWLTRAERVAGGLESLGIVQGDRVAILSRNSAEFAIARFAISALGAVLVPVNFMLNTEEAAYVLSHSEARLLMVGATEVDKARAAAAQCSNLQSLVWLAQGEAPAGMRAFDELLAAQPLQRPTAIVSDAPAQIIYTSGTESAPKGAVLSHAAVLWQYGSIIADAEVATDDRLLHAMPLYHCAQLDCFLGPAVQVGAFNVITNDNSAANLLTLLERESITSFFAPPTVWIALLNDSRFEGTDLSQLRKGYYGASIMPVEILREIQRRLPQLRLWNLYGQTEIAPVATILKPADQIRKAGSAGRPVINVETRVVDDDGEDVAIGEIGEVVHRSPQLLSEYYKNPEKTAEAFAGGWFHSGDLATVDKEGYLTIVDRKKDMIKSGGENVSGREVEETVYGHAAVAEVAVIGVPHSRWIAVVVAKSGATRDADDLIAHCRRSLAGFKVPKAVVFVDELPRNPSGKILKRDLRRQFEDLFSEAR